MKRFDSTELWEAFKTSDSASAGLSVEPNGLFNDFVIEVQTYCREEKDIAERTRTLNYARGELVAYTEEGIVDSKRHRTIRAILKRAIHFIESEIDLIKMELAHPERFITFPSDSAPLIRWGASTADLIEYTIGPQAAGILQLPSGKPMNFEEAVIFLEKIFGITIPNVYDRRGRILDRQKNTAFQDEMRRIFLEEAKKRSK